MGDILGHISGLKYQLLVGGNDDSPGPLGFRQDLFALVLFQLKLIDEGEQIGQSLTTASWGNYMVVGLEDSLRFERMQLGKQGVLNESGSMKVPSFEVGSNGGMEREVGETGKPEGELIFIIVATGREVIEISSRFMQVLSGQKEQHLPQLLSYIISSQHLPICLSYKYYTNISDIQMQQEGTKQHAQQQAYQVDLTELRRMADLHEWQEVDSMPDEDIFVKGHFNFIPSQNDRAYYKRLRYALTVQQSGTDRVFALSAYILALNTNNYYALMLRKKCFFPRHLSEEGILNFGIEAVQAELYLVNCLLNENSKQYQLWNYKKDIFRACLAINMPVTSALGKEFEFMEFLLVNEDTKNYHVWDFHVFLVSSQGTHLILKELERSKTMIYYDQLGPEARNIWAQTYSLWSYRLNLLKMLGKEEAVGEQCQRVFAFLMKNCLNECAWNYLGGLIEEFPLYKNQLLKQVEEQLERNHIVTASNRFALNFLYLGHPDQHKKAGFLEMLMKIDSTRMLYYEYESR